MKTQDTGLGCPTKSPKHKRAFLKLPIPWNCQSCRSHHEKSGAILKKITELGISTTPSMCQQPLTPVCMQETLPPAYNTYCCNLHISTHADNHSHQHTCRQPFTSAHTYAGICTHTGICTHAGNKSQLLSHHTVYCEVIVILLTKVMITMIIPFSLHKNIISNHSSLTRYRIETLTSIVWPPVTSAFLSAWSL